MRFGFVAAFAAGMGGLVAACGGPPVARDRRAVSPSLPEEEHCVAGEAGCEQPNAPRPAQLASGQVHSCAIVRSGQISCWGDNSAGQVGTGRRDAAPFARRVPDISDAVELALGPASSCARRSDGSVWCWGAGWSPDPEELRSPAPLGPRRVGDALGVTALTVDVTDRVCVSRSRAGVTCFYPPPNGRGFSIVGIRQVAELDHTCAVRPAGKLACWPLHPPDSDEGELPFVAHTIEGLPEIAASSLGPIACVLDRTGGVWCWDEASSKSLSYGTRPARAPERVPGLDDATAIASGGRQTCAIRSSGRVVCWHREGSAARLSQPKPVPTIDDAVSLSAGTRFACAGRKRGVVECWGQNDRGQLGNGLAEVVTSPVRVKSLGPIVDFDAGAISTCAVLDSGKVRCSGNLDRFQRGPTLEPTEVPGIDGATAISSGISLMCAKVAPAVLRCFRLTDLEPGKVGFTSPEELRFPTAIADFEVGPDHACAILERGELHCWGKNKSGQLGDGSRTDRKQPVKVRGLGRVNEVALSYEHTCALGEDGKVSCWGNNNWRQVRGRAGAASTVPVAVADVGPSRSLAAQQFYSCAVLRDGHVRCWGLVPIGNPVLSEPNDTMSLEGIASATAITAGSDNVCVLLDSARVQCAGYAKSPALGAERARDGPLTVAIPPLSSVADVDCGEWHCCARTTNAELWCWGRGAFGQLGIGATLWSDEPVTVQGL